MWSKSLFASKTFWVNAIAATVTILTAVVDSDLVIRYPQLAQGFALAVSLLNVYLRWLTDTPVHLVERFRN